MKQFGCCRRHSGCPLTASHTFWAPGSGAREAAALDKLGFRPGSTGPVASVLVDPPQRTRPFLLLPAPLGTETPASNIEVALLVNPDGLNSDLHLTVEALLSKVFLKWPAARARAVDEHAVTLIQRGLSRSRALTNIFMSGSSGMEELDGVIIYEDIAVVVEGKGAPLKLAGRRGSVDKLVAQLKELVAKGAEQLERDRNYLVNGNPARFYDETGKCVLEIDGTALRRCYKLLPTIDGLGDVGTALPRLVELGVLAPEARPWIIGVTDLNIVTDILRRPADLVGYMEFREKWAGEPRLVIADEIEMLSLYLYQVDISGRLSKTSENFRIFHPVNQAAFDAWYDGQSGVGPIADRPTVRTTTRMRRFIDAKQQMKPDGWLASVTAARQVAVTIATALDIIEADLAASARKEGVVVRRDHDHALIVAAQNVPWPVILNEFGLRKIIAESPLTLLLRQRGRRLDLEDVRLPR